MATLDTIKNILNENLDIDPETVGEESTFESLGIDSLDMVELICDLEEACEVDFGEPENLETVGDLVSTSTACRTPKLPAQRRTPGRQAGGTGDATETWPTCAHGRREPKPRAPQPAGVAVPPFTAPP